MPAFVSATTVDHDERQQDAPTLLERGEKLYSPAALAKVIRVPGQREGTHLNGSTLFRHITKGVRAANGELIRLEADRVGSRWLSSREAFARFTAKLTAAALPTDSPPSPPTPTPRQRSRAAAAASREADAIFGAAGE
ncbi:hypothetical protein [Frigoriglobus tundricola]|uniref:Uncharacterized protein n=1 Tax=Frigoriglobus tundricola TaxID=2774151 RepID=A0A6M5Z595_9BACT|nr:hypothetical protein [Frigoriglobus tundricola]QJX01256.1 hypothetical protein FTUN_8895 [Frigoriglobus tundricola]